MEFLEHGVDVVGRVHGDINAGRKCALAAAQNHGRDLSPRLKLLQRDREFVYHLEVEDVERRMSEVDVGDGSLATDSNSFGGGRS